MKRLSHFLLLAGLGGLLSCSSLPQSGLHSPDKQISLSVYLTPQHTLAYSVARQGQTVLLESDLGLVLEGADFAHDLSLNASSAITQVSDDYQMMVGKKHSIHYAANEQVFHVENAHQQKMDLVFRVSNDGVAFRYVIADESIKDKQFISEATSFHFDNKARAWLQPMAMAKTGWSNVNPSYEELYQNDMPVGAPAPETSGWVFPALFHTGDNWVALSETNMDGSWHGSRLQQDSSGGEYKIGSPMKEEVFTGGGLLAHSYQTLTSPWRIVALGPLNKVMESTLGTDLAAPAISFDAKLVQPGHSSWSWALLKDDFTVFDVQKKFIDYAADMHWDYTLVDADWDQKIGYDKAKELVDYAAQKGIGILLWYNSSGDWNTTPYTPKSKLLTHQQRELEFARLQAMGVKGVKIDFFGGDGQSMIKYYVDILKDAAKHQLLVNFHGATLPRGLERTYPNLMSAEAIRGLEFTTFEQANEDAVPAHAVTALYTRNLFDPMDFTPMVFADIPNIKRSTRNGFELAESVLFLSGIQHFAEIPEGMATVPAYVKSFLQNLPRHWDEVKFIDGYPGKYAVIARKAGDSWYVAAMNAQGAAMDLQLDLSFIDKAQGQLINDGEDGEKGGRELVSQPVTASAKTPVNIKAKGGFVMVFNTKP